MLHLSCVRASRIALSSAYVSESEGVELGASAVTPSEIILV